MKKTILFGLAASLSFGGLQAQNDANNLKDIEVARQVIAEYVNTRQDIARVKNEWSAYQELTQNRIDLYRAEIERLRNQIDQAADQTTQAEREIARIRDEIADLRAATNVVTEALPELEDKVRELYSFFPEPLKNKVESLAQRLGKRNTRTTDRMSIVIAIMNEADKFNSEFSIQEDERVIAGETKLVDIVYLGLGIAYYADKDGAHAGVGTPARNGWNWEERDSIAPAVREAVSYFRGDIKPAMMVNLPISLTDITSAN